MFGVNLFIIAYTYPALLRLRRISFGSRRKWYLGENDINSDDDASEGLGVRTPAETFPGFLILSRVTRGVIYKLPRTTEINVYELSPINVYVFTR